MTNTAKILKSKIVEWSSPSSFAKGKQYYESGRVSDWKWSNGRLIGIVRGSKNYQVNIYFGPHGDWEGDCACPVGCNCKHAVAVLLAAHAKEQSVQSAHWENWLEDIQSKTEQEIKERFVLYTLSQTFCGVFLEVGVTQILKDGTGYRKPISVMSSSPEWKKYAIDDDILVMHHMDDGNWKYIPITEKVSGNVLDKMLNTGRVVWETHRQSPIQIGPERALSLDWEINNKGIQVLSPHVEGEAILLSSEPVRYIDPENNLYGPVRSEFPDAVVSKIRKAPKVSPAEVGHARDYLAQISDHFPLPKNYKTTTTALDLVPRLVLSGHRDVFKGGYPGYGVVLPDVCPLLQLSFCYGEAIIPYGETRSNTITHIGDHEIVIYERDLEKEEKCARYLKNLKGFCDLTDPFRAHNVKEKFRYDFTVGEPGMNRADRAIALAKGLPKLRKAGWEIIIEDSFPLKVVEDTPRDWYVDTDQKEGNQWFDLELGILIDGQQVNILPAVTQLLSTFSRKEVSRLFRDDLTDYDFSLKLEDGRYVVVPVERLKTVLKTLYELMDPKSLNESKLRLPIQRAGELAHLSEDGQLKWGGSEHVQELGKKLNQYTGIKPVTPPTKLEAKLRVYQQDGLNWLQFLSEYGFGGILADDMGLGKTVQAIAHICKEIETGKQTKPTLIVAPTSVLINWQSEIETFAPHLKVVTIHGPQRQEHFPEIPTAHVVLTTYPLLAKDYQILTKHHYHAVILDEAQMIKNHQSKSAQVCRSLKTNHRICLTGTPMENHLEELWSLMHFLNRGLLGGLTQFNKFFRFPIEKNQCPVRHQALIRRISPFILRRTKKSVVTELPPKTEILKRIELQGDQRELYEGIRLSMQKKVQQALAKKGINGSQIVILDALLKMRQACCDPSLLKMDLAKNVKQSSKLKTLEILLDQLVQEKRKILIFSSFTSMLSIVEKLIQDKKYPYVKLTGSTKDRKTPIDTFQSGKADIFLISLKAGGTGLNLTAADTVIHYDPWWNPAAENQATDRAHRIGQDKAVFVYKLIASQTVEDKILKLQQRKQALVDSLYDKQGQATAKITQSDLDDLFAPLSDD